MKTSGYSTIEKARAAAQRRADSENVPVRIVRADDGYRTTIYPTAWPQHETLETVTPSEAAASAGWRGGM